MGAWRALQDWLTEPESTANPDIVPAEEGEEREARIDGRDLHAYGGLILLAAGALLIYPPAALVVTGAVLLYLGVWRMG